MNTWNKQGNMVPWSREGGLVWVSTKLWAPEFPNKPTRSTHTLNSEWRVTTVSFGIHQWAEAKWLTGSDIAARGSSCPFNPCIDQHMNSKQTSGDRQTDSLATNAEMAKWNNESLSEHRDICAVSRNVSCQNVCFCSPGWMETGKEAAEGDKTSSVSLVKDRRSPPCPPPLVSANTQPLCLLELRTPTSCLFQQPYCSLTR